VKSEASEVSHQRKTFSTSLHIAGASSLINKPPGGIVCIPLPVKLSLPSLAKINMQKYFPSSRASLINQAHNVMVMYTHRAGLACMPGCDEKEV
jgi:hypothetical protein